MNKGTMLMVKLIAVMASVGSDFMHGFILEGNKPRTPQIAMGGLTTRHRPHIPNGKWVMKYHRSRR